VNDLKFTSTFVKGEVCVSYSRDTGRILVANTLHKQVRDSPHWSTTFHNRLVTDYSKLNIKLNTWRVHVLHCLTTIPSRQLGKRGSPVRGRLSIDDVLVQVSPRETAPPHPWGRRLRHSSYSMLGGSRDRMDMLVKMQMSTPKSDWVSILLKRTLEN